MEKFSNLFLTVIFALAPLVLILPLHAQEGEVIE